MDGRVNIMLVFTLVLLGAGTALHAEYSVQERFQDVELTTPWGKKLIMGELGPDRMASYRYEIPLSQLRPEPVPTPTPNPQQLLSNIALLPPTPNGAGDKKTDDAETEEAKKRNPASLPPRIIVEYDETDKLVLEANHLFNKRKYLAATNVVEEILRKKPDYTRAWLMKGSLLKLQGHHDLAKTSWQKALALDPNNKEIQSLVGGMK